MPTRAFMEEAIEHLIGGGVEITKISRTDWYPPWKKARGKIVNLNFGLHGLLEIEVSDLRDEQGRMIENASLALNLPQPNFLRIYLPGSVIRKTCGWERIILSYAYEWRLTPP